MEAKVKYQALRNDLFYTEIKQEVNNYFESNKLSIKANRTMKFKAVTICSIMLFLYLLILLGQLSPFMNLVCLTLLGFSIVCTGFNICHEALHNAFFKSKKWNDRLGYLMDLLGPSSYLWKINHGRHHAYTNIHGLDGDIKDSPILRLCPYAPYKKAHKHQRISAVFIYSFFFLILIFGFNIVNIFGKKFSNNQTVKHPIKEVILFFAFKFIYALIWIIIPILVMGLSAQEFLIGYLFLNIVIGTFFTLVFIVAHNLEVVDFKESNDNTSISWAEHQIKTTANFNVGTFGRLILGGMNHQIEHHLFPNMSSVHYPKISNIIQDTCAKHDVSYHTNPSLWKAIRLHFDFLKKMSVPPQSTQNI